MKNDRLHFLYYFSAVFFAVFFCSVLHGTPARAQETPVISGRLFPVIMLSDTAEILQYIQRGKQLKGYHNDSAEMLLYTALQHSKRLAFATGTKQALTALANVYIEKGAYSEAINIYQSTIRYCHNIPALHTALYAMYNNLANVYIKQSDYEQAIINYKHAITALERYNPQHSGEVYNNLGGLLIQMRRYEHVPYYLELAEQASINNRDSAGLGSVYGNKTSYYFETGMWDTSVHYAHKAIQLARMQGNTQLEFMALINAGELYRRGKRSREALTYLQQAQAISQSELPVYRNHLLTVLGNTHLDLEQYATAETCFLVVLQNTTPGATNKNIKNAYKGLAQAYEKQGQYEHSLKYYKAFLEIEKKIAGEELVRDISAWELKYRTAEKDKEIIAGKLEISQQKNDIRQRNFWITGILSGALMLAIVFGSFYRSLLQKRRLQQQQYSLLQQQQELEQLKAIMTGEEKERERMARELHDGIGGMLAAIRMNLSAVWERQKDLTDKEQLNHILTMLGDTSTEVRRAVHNMLPDVLTQHHLEEALMIYCEHINLSNTLRVHFQFHADTGSLDKSAELFLYRISQELLQNIVKHAHAENAWLMIKELNGKLSIIVEDDGAGFDPSVASRGYGLLNMQYRVKSLQGDVSIQSHPNRGTTVHIAFDMDKLNKNISA